MSEFKTLFFLFQITHAQVNGLSINQTQTKLSTVPLTCIKNKDSPKLYWTGQNQVCRHMLFVENISKKYVLIVYAVCVMP